MSNGSGSEDDIPIQPPVVQKKKVKKVSATTSSTGNLLNIKVSNEITETSGPPLSIKISESIKTYQDFVEAVCYETNQDPLPGIMILGIKQGQETAIDQVFPRVFRNYIKKGKMTDFTMVLDEATVIEPAKNIKTKKEPKEEKKKLVLATAVQPKEVAVSKVKIVKKTRDSVVAAI